MWLLGLKERKLPVLALGLIDWPIGPASEGSDTFHSRTVLSLPPLARVRPPGLYVSDTTASVWPVSGEPSRVVLAGSVRSHSRTVSSSPPLARVWPSGL